MLLQEKNLEVGTTPEYRVNNICVITTGPLSEHTSRYLYTNLL